MTVVGYPYADYQARRPDQGLSPTQEAVVVAIAAYLASSAAVHAVTLPAALMGRLMALGLSRRAVRAASRLTMDPPLTGRTRWGSPSPSPAGADVSMVRMVAADEPLWRARYLLAAAQRLTDAAVRGDFTGAVTKERRYLRQHRAAGKGRRAGAAQADQAAAQSRTGLLEWVGGTCPECSPLDGSIFRPGQLSLPPRHPNCLIGSSRISARVVTADIAHRLSEDVSSVVPSHLRQARSSTTATPAESERDFGRSNIRAVTVRDYVGDVVAILTASGKELTGTPNHPVATRSGWVALAELYVGMDVLSSTGPEWEVTSVHPHEDHVPPTIEQVAQTFSMAFDPMPTCPQDFHGDGAGSEVHVVLADGLLGYDVESLCPKHAAEFQFGRRDVAAESAFQAPSAGLKLGDSGLPPSDGVVSGSGPAGAFLGQQLAHVGTHSLAGSPSLDSISDEDPRYGRAADSEGFCERLHALTREVSADQIVEVRRYPFSGHVYNLETVDGWFIGNGIITHNCGCSVRAV